MDRYVFDRTARLLECTSIALVGKYTKFTDSYASVIKALEHSALAINYKLEVKVRRALDLMTPLLRNLCTSVLLWISFSYIWISSLATCAPVKIYILKIFFLSKFQYIFINESLFQFIDSANLERSTEQEDPVKYHKAWQELCSAE